MLETTLDVTPDEAYVKFSMTVTNAGEEPVTLSFRDGQRADFVVYEGDEEVWRWSAGKMFTQALAQDDLPPGHAQDYEGDWENPSEGTYRVVGEVTATDRDLSAEAEFSV